MRLNPQRLAVALQERSQRMPIYGGDILRVIRELESSSAWTNEFTGEALQVPTGWDAW